MELVTLEDIKNKQYRKDLTELRNRIEEFVKNYNDPNKSATDLDCELNEITDLYYGINYQNEYANPDKLPLLQNISLFKRKGK